MAKAFFSGPGLISEHKEELRTLILDTMVKGKANLSMVSADDLNKLSMVSADFTSFGLLGDTKGQFDGNSLAVLLTRSTPFPSSPADGAHVRWSDANGAELFGRSAEDE